MIHKFLCRLKEQHPAWQMGDNLSCLLGAKGVLRELGQLVGGALRRNMRNLHGSEAHHLGAALVLYGAFVFRDKSTEPLTYETIGKSMGVSDLAERLGNLGRDLMERGLRDVWGLPVLRGADGHRRFRATMLFHAGGTWDLVEQLCHACSRLYGLDTILRDDDTELAARMQTLSQAPEISLTNRKILGSEEAQLGIGERLRMVAQVRSIVIREGLLRADATSTLDAALEAGWDMRSRLDAGDDGAVIRILTAIFPFQQEDRATASAAQILELRLEFSSGNWPKMVIAIPERLALPNIPTDVSKVRLCAEGADERDRPVFRRLGDVFERFHGPSTLHVHETAKFPLSVMAEYILGADRSEVEIDTVEFPHDVVAMFDPTSGRRVRAAVAEERIALVSAPGIELEPPAGFDRVSAPCGKGQTIWIGQMPRTPLGCRFSRHYDDPSVHWLAPDGQDINVHVFGVDVPRLRMGWAKSYRQWPRIWVHAPRDFTCRVVGPCGDEDVSIRRNEIRHCSSEPRVGRYRVVIEFNRTAYALTFVLLPPDTSFHMQSSARGTTLSASIAGQPIGLACPALSTCSRGTMHWGPDVRGTFDVTVDVPIANGDAMVLRWTVVAAPPHVTILSRRGGEPAKIRDMALLRGDGGLLIQGPPSSSFTVDVDGYRWSQKLGPDGERFFPFGILPSTIFPQSDNAVHVDVLWNSGESQRLDPFVDGTAKRPPAKVRLDSEGQPHAWIRADREFAGDVHLHAVRAWKPWEDAWEAVAMRVEGETECWYSARMPPEPGPYQVTLMQNEQRVVGMALLVSPEDFLKAPEELDALSRELWGEPSTRLEDLFAARLAKQDGLDLLANLFIQLRKYGPRWFRIHLAMVDTATHHRLEALLGVYGRDVDRLLMDVFDEIGIPRLALRYDDFSRVLAHHSPGPAKILQWFDEIASLGHGLLIPAWRAWNSSIPGDGEWIARAMPIIGPWHDLDKPLVMLSHDQLDLLQTPGDHEPNDAKLPTRLRGLLEARLSETRLRTAASRRVEELRQAIRKLGAEGSDDQMPDGLTAMQQRGIPLHLIEIEKAIARITRRVHHWRARKLQSLAALRDTGLLAEEFPRLVDFWLNRWAVVESRECDHDE